MRGHKRHNSWGLIIPSVADGTRPSTAFDTVTPGNNTYGSYVQIIDGSSEWPTNSGDAYMLDLHFFNNFVSTQARDTIATIGIDLAGGTSYTDWIQHLMISFASGITASHGACNYRFPIRVPSGASLAVKGSINNATVGTFAVYARLYCKPSWLEGHRYGTFVRTYGATTASSNGTAVVPGTASEGSWADLGTLADDIFWLEYGLGINSNSLASNSYHIDVGHGDASNKKVAIMDAIISTNTDESMTKQMAGVYCDAASGDHVYGRAQVGPNTASANTTMIAYGVGG